MSIPIFTGELPDPSDRATYGPRGRAVWDYEVNTLVPAINETVADIEVSKSQVDFNAGLASAMAAMKGNWSSLSGALNKPASVIHLDKTWVLLTNLANVATAEPGISPSWVEYTDDAYVMGYGSTTVGDELDSLQAVKSFAPDGYRNKVRNGNFSVNQRGATGTVTLAPGAFGHDGWKGGAAGCTYTFAKANGITTLTITSGSLQQAMEGDNFTGTKSYTLSWVGTAQGRITTSGTYTASPQTAQLSGGAVRLIEFNTGTVSQVMFEEGSVARGYSPRQSADELVLCQRYYGPVNTFYRRFDAIVSNGTDGGIVGFPVTPRALPTVSLSLSGVNVSTLDNIQVLSSGVRFTFIWSNAGSTVARDAIVTGTYSAEV